MMSLENREGKDCEETEPEELPELVQIKLYCERQETDWRLVRLSVILQKDVFFLPI